MKYILAVLPAFLILLTNHTISVAQNLADQPFIAASNASGEETVKTLEAIATDAENSGERLFVIARLGKGEKLIRRGQKYVNINFARLSYAKAFLLAMRRFPLQSPVFAEGERTDGEGRIEFYLGSRLRLVTLAKRNQIPNLTCCPDYIPPKKRKAILKRKIKR